MTQETLFDQAIRLLAETASDPALPHSDRLYQIAGAAVGFGLQFAGAPSEIDTLLYWSGIAPSLLEESDGIARLVQKIASPHIQESLRYAARRIGTPLLALLAGWVLYHFQATRREPDPAGREYLQAAASFCLHFTLLLARLHPDLADHYRTLVPVLQTQAGKPS